MPSSHFGPIWRGIPSFRLAVPQVLWAGLLFVGGFVVNDVASGVAMWRSRALLATAHRAAHPPQPDVGWAVVGEPLPALCGTDDAGMLPTAALLAFMVACLVRMMLLDTRGLYIGLRFALIEGAVLTLRACTVWVTSLDNPWPGCENCGQGPKGACPDTLWGCIKLTALGGFPFFDCGDSVFSGHTVQYALVGLIWFRFYDGVARRAVLGFVLAAVGAGLFSLLNCRYHYTLDLVVALFLTGGGWWLVDVMYSLAAAEAVALSSKSGGESHSGLARVSRIARFVYFVLTPRRPGAAGPSWSSPFSAGGMAASIQQQDWHSSSSHSASAGRAHNQRNFTRTVSKLGNNVEVPMAELTSDAGSDM